MSTSNSASPPDETATIFSTLPNQFPSVTQDNKIKTDEFLNASTGVVILLEKFGKVFTPVVHDMNGNIKKIKEKYQEDIESHEFIEDMILKAQRGGQLVVVDALQWLRRGLHFISSFFKLVIEDTCSGTNSQDLSPLIKSAYKETLERYHGWLGSQLFNILSRFVPNRHYFLYIFALERHNKEDHVVRDMKIFVVRMSSCVEKLAVFYLQHNLETSNRV